MSDRLEALKRQRALAQEQVAWFDREIARETGEMPAVASLLESQPVTAPPAPTVTAPPNAVADILARYQQEPSGSMAKDARRGCILYFVLAMGLMAIFAIGAYVIYAQTRDNSESDPPAAVAP